MTPTPYEPEHSSTVEVPAVPESATLPPLVQNKALKLRSDVEVLRARAQHPALFIMVEYPTDQACKLAADMFERAAALWAKRNVAFARVDMQKATNTASLLGARTDRGIDGLPKYALSLAGSAALISYVGGWSEESLSSWLQHQLALSPVNASSLSDLSQLVTRNKHGLAVIGLLTDAQRERRLLELAARGAEARAAIVHGDDHLAGAMGLAVPSIVVVSSDPSVPWALMKPPFTQIAVESFLWRRGLPLVVQVGDHERSFAKHVREHAHNDGLQVILVHISGQRGQDDESESALAELHRAAIKQSRTALFLAYDFFDNDPDQFTSRGLYASELPTLLVVHGRGRPQERLWVLGGTRNMSGSGQPIRASAVVRLIRKASEELGEAAAANLGWEEVSAPDAYADALDECDAEQGEH